jgi:hypothetical protein
MKALFKIIVAALVVHACFRAGTVYWRHYQFEDGVERTAQFGGKNAPNEVHDRVMEIAREFQIPLEPRNVKVRRQQNHMLIDAVYMERIELLPRYFYPWQFTVNVDAFTITPGEAHLP